MPCSIGSGGALLHRPRRIVLGGLCRISTTILTSFTTMLLDVCWDACLIRHTTGTAYPAEGNMVFSGEVLPVSDNLHERTITPCHHCQFLEYLEKPQSEAGFQNGIKRNVGEWSTFANKIKKIRCLTSPLSIIFTGWESVMRREKGRMRAPMAKRVRRRVT